MAVISSFAADACDRIGTALQAAAYCDHTKITELLLARGADPNIESCYLVTAFMAAYCMGHTETEDLLRAAGAGLDSPLALFCNVQNASELSSLLQIATVGSSKNDIGILGAAAIQYLRMGQTISLEEMALLTLEKTEILFGGDHSNTLHCCEFSARLSALHNKNEKAEAMARRALNGLMTIVGQRI